MKTIKIRYSRTIQVQQFEPATIEAIIEREISTSEEKKIDDIYEEEFNKLSEFVDERIEELMNEDES